MTQPQRVYPSVAYVDLLKHSKSSRPLALGPHVAWPVLCALDSRHPARRTPLLPLDGVNLAGCWLGVRPRGAAWGVVVRE
jgi:hypothetical protein